MKHTVDRSTSSIIPAWDLLRNTVNSCLLTFSPLIHVKETLIQTSCLSNQSLWFNRNYEIENPSFRSLKIFIRQTDKWHCQINANCQLTSQRVVVAITVCAAWCAWTVNGAGPDVVSGCACIASFEFRRGKFKQSEEKFLNHHGTSKFLIVIWYFSIVPPTALKSQPGL